MSGLFVGTPLERPVTCERCELPLEQCRCPRDAAGRILLPQQQTAMIRLEKRGKAKLVTTVAGLDPSASDLPGLLKALKSACGAGGTIEVEVIEVQGDHRDRIAAQLASMGYKTKIK